MKNKKRYILLFLIFILIISITTSCKKADPNTVHLWMYQRDQNDQIAMLIPDIERYCENNEIPLQIHCYYESEMSYDDYILKRNINLEKNNTIVCGNYNEMRNLNSEHANYENIENYKNIVKSCKNLPYMLVAYTYNIRLINKNLLDVYDINFDKDIMSPTDYRNIIFRLLENGADLSNDSAINNACVTNLMYEYNLNLNNTTKESEIDEEYRNNLANAIRKFVEKSKDRTNIALGCSKTIIDNKTNLTLDIGYGSDCREDNCYYTDFNKNTLLKSLKDTIVLFEPDMIRYAIYINDKITNESTYKLANYMLDSELLGENIRFSCFTLKNDCADNMYMNIVNNNVEIEEYYKENETELKCINEIIERNILNGNISEEFINELSYKTLGMNSLMECFIMNAQLFNINRGEEKTEEFIDINLDNFIKKIKLSL
ncbi:hypothetical protein JYG23_11540 [Sedimentibacter sp. zth1]|uniref:hypothetical protein n=1 Tax=Sedimentibacter sp. zth1 TaxID=2816908 RepID=UPI001A91C84F|nr:hypothetical protein [Sedimentibacter sp. zth1]QSX05303.1 hypothetical protein JYG23_11540 [Sedimentibacter sp. zth1]